VAPVAPAAPAPPFELAVQYTPVVLVNVGVQVVYGGPPEKSAPVIVSAEPEEVA